MIKPFESQTPALEGHQPFQVEISLYQAKGYVVFRNVFTSAELSAWRAEADDVWNRVELDSAQVQWRDHISGERVPDRIDPLLPISSVFRQLSSDQRICERVASLVSGPVLPFKGKVIRKQPGTLGYGLHQDYPYYEFLGVPAEHFAIALVPLDPCTEESGAVEVYPGQHQKRLDSPEDNPLDIDAEQFGYGIRNYSSSTPATSLSSMVISRTKAAPM